jgi:hypothetical protein
MKTLKNRILLGMSLYLAFKLASLIELFLIFLIRG